MTKSSDPTDQRRLKATIPGMLGQPGVRGEAPSSLGRREHTNASWNAQLPREPTLPATSGLPDPPKCAKAGGMQTTGSPIELINTGREGGHTDP